MLDLEALIVEMQGLAQQVVHSAEDTLRQRDVAERQLQAARAMPELREKIQRYGQDMALPAAGCDMGRTYRAQPAEDYTVIATDGSQVAPDFHHIAPWYVVNTGCAVLRYGAPPGRPRCRLASQPRLLPPSAAGRPAQAEALDAEERTADARSAAVAVRGRLEVERMVSELEAASRMLEEEGDAGRTVLLLDGPLVQWRMIHEVRPAQAHEEVLRVFRELLDRARETGTPIAGYISRSQAVAWITLLRYTLCPEVAKDGRLCTVCAKSFLKPTEEPAPGAHHAALATLRDIQLVERLLPEQGMRTEVVELQSQVWQKITGGGDAAGFFYLNTGLGAGGEIARVEVPQWVWEAPELMERLHSALWDQCESGRGYPMVLSEAHEAAVVRTPDREAFYALIERVLNTHGLGNATTSAKALSKRRPLA